MKLTPETAYLFWDGPCSQWLDVEITIDGVKYNCNEQYMMAQKALIFGDTKRHEAIMFSNSPRNQKALGRAVKGFDVDIWSMYSRLIVYRANFAKFTQDQVLYDFLMNTDDKMIVEASPYDTIWGIGLSENDPDAWDTDKWKGQNLLGQMIMQVRSDIRQLNKSISDKICL